MEPRVDTTNRQKRFNHGGGGGAGTLSPSTELTAFNRTGFQYGDVLYVTTPTNRPALTDEDDVVLLWRYSTDNGELVGVTILDYGAYWKSHREDLAGRSSDHFHVPAGEVEKLLPDVEPA